MLILMTISIALAFAAAASDPSNYRFVERTDRYVALFTTDRFKLGRLGRNGEFVVTRELPYGFHSGLPVFTMLPSGSVRPRRVYELRDEWLVLGWMRDGAFLADAKHQRLRFSAYRYTPWSVPIWNLPGHFEFTPSPKPAATAGG